jgi:diketogulonate reductase-like aldo/keto reductase
MLKFEDCAELNNGVKIPWLGFGVFEVPEGEEVIQSVLWALEAGYRSIDTAKVYRNEEGVGKAIKQSGVPREEIFVTTKVWNRDQGYQSTLDAFDASLKRLQLDYLDLYLIHWPVKGKYVETWRAMETLYKSGKCRSVGVSNYMIPNLEDLKASSDLVPAVNQIEYHPYLQSPELYEYCKQHGTVLEAWAPIMKGQVMQVPELIAIGEKYGKTPVQVSLRWILQKGVIAIPKSVHRERIFSNKNIYDFELSAEDMQMIAGLDRGYRTGPDPFNFDF